MVNVQYKNFKKGDENSKIISRNKKIVFQKICEFKAKAIQ